MKGYLLKYNAQDGISFHFEEFLVLTKNKLQLENLCFFFNKYTSSSDYSIEEVNVFNNEINFFHLEEYDENFSLYIDSFTKNTLDFNDNNYSSSTLEIVNSLSNKELNQLFSKIFIYTYNYKYLSNVIKKEHNINKYF